MAAALVVQLSALVILHAGFYEVGLTVAQWSTAALVVLALAARQRLVIRSVACVSALGLVASALASGVGAGDVGAAVQTVRVFTVVAALGAVVGGMTASQRRLVLDGFVLLASVAVIIGIHAVIRRDVPEAALSRDLWRAASTLWYPNALGALAGAAGVAAVARSALEPGRPLPSTLSYVLFAGVVATLSRGAAIGVAAGLVLVGASVGFGPLLRTTTPIVIGLGVFVAGYAQAVSPGEARPLLAWGGLVAGGLLVNAAARAPRSLQKALPLLAIVGVVVIGGVVAGRFSANLGTGALEDRLDIWEAAAGSVVERPLLGVGPGHVTYVYRDGIEPRLARYAHNDYLELTVQQGLIGLTVLIMGATAASRAALARRHTTDPVMWAGAAGALVVLGLHASLDFLARFPLLLMIGAVLVAVLTTDVADQPPGAAET